MKGRKCFIMCAVHLLYVDMDCSVPGILAKGVTLPRMKQAELVNTVLEVDKVGLSWRTHINVRLMFSFFRTLKLIKRKKRLSWLSSLLLTGVYSRLLRRSGADDWLTGLISHGRSSSQLEFISFKPVCDKSTYRSLAMHVINISVLGIYTSTAHQVSSDHACSSAL